MIFTIIAKYKDTDMEKKWYFSKTNKGSLKRLHSLKEKDKNLLATDATSKLDTKAFFSTSWFTWISEKIPTQIFLEIHCNKNEKLSFEPDTFAYITHIGALLVAIDAKDSLMTAEIFHRNKKIFLSFSEITEEIIKPIAAEALFAWVYGGFCQGGEQRLYDAIKNNFPEKSNWDVVEFFYFAAKEILQAKSSSPDAETKIETPKQMFLRFFESHRNITLTLGLVGTDFTDWSFQNMQFLQRRLRKQQSLDEISGTSLAEKAKSRIFGQIKSMVQAEPENPHHHYAIAVFLDDLGAKATGKNRLQKAGYIRRTGAEIIRKARPEKIDFDSKLFRLGGTAGSAKIVVSLTV